MKGEGIIVVGVDGSAGGQRATAWALGEAGVHGDQVLLVHVWQFPAVGFTSVDGNPVPVFEPDAIETAAAELLSNAAGDARRSEPRVDLDTRLIEGHPAAALVEASSAARLLVVGSRGLGGFKGMLIGSVSSACACHARCPVVIVPPGAPRRPGSRP